MDKLTIETKPNENCAVRVEFFKADSYPDRWMHQVVVVRGEETAVVLSSIEGDDEQIWPPSPPIQDPSLHELADGGAVLGVGMAGKSHWSASASVTAENEIFFDMACLVKSSGGTLGSSYRCGEGVTFEPQDDGMLIRHPLGDVTLAYAKDDAVQSVVNVDGEATAEARVCVGPAGFDNPCSASSQDGPQTLSDSDSRNSLQASLRWQYRFFLAK